LFRTRSVRSCFIAATGGRPLARSQVYNVSSRHRCRRHDHVLVGRSARSLANTHHLLTGSLLLRKLAIASSQILTPGGLEPDPVRALCSTLGLVVNHSGPGIDRAAQHRGERRMGSVVPGYLVMAGLARYFVVRNGSAASRVWSMFSPPTERWGPSAVTAL